MRTLSGLRGIANDMNKSTEQLLYEMLCDCMNENEKYKKIFSEINEICKSVPPTWSICGTDIVAKIEGILKEVE